MKNEVSRLRKERKISQDALALAMGVSRQTICSIENGKYNPSIILAIHIARFFGKTVEDVFVADDMTNWKSAETLLAVGKQNPNYEENKKLSLSAEPIIGQAEAALESFRCGKFSLSAVGAEAIALYNCSIFAEKPRTLADIVLELEENDMMLLDGYAGADPKSLGRYFLGHGIPYKMYTVNDLFDKHIRRKCGVFIYAYFDADMKTRRTVSGVYDELGLTVYNETDDAQKPKAYKTAKALAEGKHLICAYVFDVE